MHGFSRAIFGNKFNCPFLHLERGFKHSSFHGKTLLTGNAKLAVIAANFTA